MPKTEFTETLVDYVDGVRRENQLAIQGGRFVLGGSEGTDGGSGGAWVSPIGQLVQTQITYDTTEAALSGMRSPSSLLDNLNHIRYNNEHLDGDNVTVTSEDNIVGALPVTFMILVPSGAAGNKDVTISNRIRVIDVWAEPTTSGQPSDTLQLKNNTDPITDEMDWSKQTDDLVRVTNLNFSNALVPAGGTLRVTTVDNDGGNDVAGGHLYILALRV